MTYSTHRTRDHAAPRGRDHGTRRHDALSRSAAAWLLDRWRPARTTRSQAARACAAAFLTPGSIRAAVRALARERARADLLAALTDLDRLFVLATGHAAPAGLVGAYLGARREAVPARPGHDRLSELPGPDRLARRLTLTLPGRPTVQVALTPRIGAYDELERLRPRLLVARHAEHVLRTPAHDLPGGDLGFAVPDGPGLAALIRRAAETPPDTLPAVADDPGALPPIHPCLVRTGESASSPAVTSAA